MALLTRLIPRLTAWIRRQYNRRRLQEVDPRAGYDLWATNYDTDEASNAVLSTERTTLEVHLPQLRGQAVLDVACGTGHYALQAAEAGARLVVGLDLSAGMLRQARRKAASGCLPVNLVQADQSRLPLASQAFDVLIHAMGAGYAPDVCLVAAELARMLQPDGVAFVSDLHPQGIQRGWRRTFAYQVGGMRREVALKSHAHWMQDYRAAFKQAGLSIANVMEPRIDETLRPFFAAANALVSYKQYRGFPLLVVFKLHLASSKKLPEKSSFVAPHPQAERATWGCRPTFQTGSKRFSQEPNAD